MYIDRFLSLRALILSERKLMAQTTSFSTVSLNSVLPLRVAEGAAAGGRDAFIVQFLHPAIGYVDRLSDLQNGCPLSTCAVTRRRFSSGCKSRLATAPAGSSRSRHIIDKVFAEAETLFGDMALRNLNAEDPDRFLELLFPRTEKQKRADQEPERWARVKAVLNDSKLTPDKTRNTLWALYNAIVRAEDYRVSRQSAPARLERVWFGSGHDLKIKALDLARSHLQQAA